MASIDELIGGGTSIDSLIASAAPVADTDIRTSPPVIATNASVDPQAAVTPEEAAMTAQEQMSGLEEVGALARIALPTPLNVAGVIGADDSGEAYRQYIAGEKDFAADILAPTEQESPLMTGLRTAAYTVDAILDPFVVGSAAKAGIKTGAKKVAAVQDTKLSDAAAVDRVMNEPTRTLDKDYETVINVEDVVTDIASLPQEQASMLLKTMEDAKRAGWTGDTAMGIRAALKDPSYYYRFKLADPSLSATERATYQDIQNFANDKSVSTVHLNNMMKKVNDRYGFGKLKTKESQDEFMKIITEADKRQNTTGKAAELSPEDLSLLTQDVKAIEMYQRYLNTQDDMNKVLNDTLVRQGKEPKPHTRGHIAHRWEDGHPVYTKDETGQGFVNTFKSEQEARRFANEKSGSYMNGETVAGQSDEIVAQISRLVKKAKVEGRDVSSIFNDVEIRKLLEKVSKSSPLSKINKLHSKRVGVQGYTNTKSYNDFILGVEQEVYTTSRAATQEGLIAEGRKLATRLLKENVDEGMAGKVVEHILDSMVVTDRGRTFAASNTAKSAAFHYFLGATAMNAVVPALNIVGNRALYWQAMKSEAIAKGYKVTDDMEWVGKRAAQATQTLLSPKPMWTADTKAVVAELENMGVLESSVEHSAWDVERAVLGESASKGSLSSLGSKLKRLNTLPMAATELASRRSVAVTAYHAAEGFGLAGKEKTRFITEMVNRTTGDFQRGLKPKVVEGGHGTLTDATSGILSMTNYVNKKMLELGLLLKVSKNSKKLSGKRDYSPMVLGLGALATFQGAENLPIIPQWIEASVYALDDATDAGGERVREFYKFSEEMKPYTESLINKYSGLDLSARMGYSLPLGVFTDYGMSAGVMGGLWQAIASSFGNSDERNKAVPSGVRNRREYIEAMRTGQYVSSTQKFKVPVPLEDDMLLMAAAITGLKPLKVAEMYSDTGKARTYADHYQNRIKKFVHQRFPEYRNAQTIPSKDMERVIKLYEQSNPSGNAATYIKSLFMQMYEAKKGRLPTKASALSPFPQYPLR